MVAFARCALSVRSVSYDTIITVRCQQDKSYTANVPGRVTLRPLAATQRWTLAIRSALLALPSTARHGTASLPSHLTAPRQRRHRPTRTRTELVRPVLDEAARARDDALFDRALARVRRLLEECPEQRDTLQCLAKAHLVCHDATRRSQQQRRTDRARTRIGSRASCRSCTGTGTGPSSARNTRHGEHIP